ncbi:rust resistance kinase Lr10-like, partial [Humulus lupulus]|uniref:rust resistance kinase Lr10-like n=1 Tax=Humulus lupulus TaxID=3486 RepID=UPI002B410E2B
LLFFFSLSIGSTFGAAAVTVVLILVYRAYNSNKQGKEHKLRIERFLEDYKALKPSRYTYADIKQITSQFLEKLGEGAYGTVYKGKLSADFFVAVKILNSSKGNGEEFINEVGTIGRIHHVNVVRLVGYCADGARRALVYEFSPNGSLQQYISSTDSEHFLGWEKLKDITLGIAKGIEYLHQGCDQRILHFDIKPHNVLLDQNFIPKISDFGLAKLCSKDQSIVSMTTARGTMGYIAPEVFSRNFGIVSYKSDIYSFGMMLLEMVGGKKITDVKEEVYYPEWIYNLLEEGEDLRIHIDKEEDAKIAQMLAIVGLWCIQWHPTDRPSMKVVVQMLEGEEELTLPPNPFASTESMKARVDMPGRRMNLELETITELE